MHSPDSFTFRKVGNDDTNVESKENIPNSSKSASTPTSSISSSCIENEFKNTTDKKGTKDNVDKDGPKETDLSLSVPHRKTGKFSFVHVLMVGSPSRLCIIIRGGGGGGGVVNF